MSGIGRVGRLSESQLRYDLKADMPETKMDGERTFHMEGEKACSKLQMGSKVLNMGNCKYFRMAGMYVCWG